MDRAETDSTDRGIEVETAKDRAVDAGAGSHHAPATLARGDIPEAGAEGHLCLVGHFGDLIGRQPEIEKPICSSERGKQRCCREAKAGADGKPADRLHRGGDTQPVKRRTEWGGRAGDFPGHSFRRPDPYNHR